MRPIEESFNDPRSLIGRRVQLEILFHQGMCVLHRKFMVQGRTDGRFEPSRRRCIHSAMALISIQEILYQEARGTVDDRIRFTRHWYRFSFTSQDFILSAMILCLDLRQNKVPEKNGILKSREEFNQESKIAAIKKAFEIWKYAQKSLLEASKVYQVLSYMIEMLGIGDKVGLQQDSTSLDRPTNNTNTGLLEDEQDQIPLPNFESSNPGDISNFDWVTQPSSVLIFSIANQFKAMWDSFVEGTSFDDAFGPMLSPPITNPTNDITNFN